MFQAVYMNVRSEFLTVVLQKIHLGCCDMITGKYLLTFEWLQCPHVASPSLLRQLSPEHDASVT
jgi:hypothetical protein